MTNSECISIKELINRLSEKHENDPEFHKHMKNAHNAIAEEFYSDLNLIHSLTHTRLKAGFSQEELAIELNVPEESIIKLEKWELDFLYKTTDNQEFKGNGLNSIMIRQGILSTNTLALKLDIKKDVLNKIINWQNNILKTEK